MIVHEGRHAEAGDRRGARFAQRHEDVFLDLGVEGLAGIVAPVRQQFIERLGIEYDAREDVRADFGALFKNGDGEVLPRFLAALLQTDGRRKAGRTSPCDDHIIFHGFALDRPSAMSSPTVSALQRSFAGTAFPFVLTQPCAMS